MKNDIIDLDNSNYVQDIITKLSDEIQKKKRDIILNRLKKLKITIDPEKESKNRFKKLAIVFLNDEETVHYDDGSEQGLRIVTFVSLKSMPATEKRSINYDIHYY